MKTMHRAGKLLALLLAASLGAGPAFSAPPPWAGGGKGEEKHEPKAKHSVDDRGSNQVRDNVGQGKNMGRKPLQPGAYFNDRSRGAVQQYYASGGKGKGNGGKACPPGLAKKNNGCLPPGQAKKQWQIGEPLPSTVVLAPVPRQIVVKLPPVPPGHRYVDVAGDILLIAVGSKMVVDGINGLMR
jgi:hypothetical protein